MQNKVLKYRKVLNTFVVYGILLSKIPSES